MIRPCSARLFSVLPLVSAALLLAAPAFACESEARAWRTKPNPVLREQLETCAGRTPNTPAAAAARLALAVSAVESQRYADALPTLQSPPGPLSAIQDYRAFFAASALAGLGRHEDALRSLEAVWKNSPQAPIMFGRAVLLAAKSLSALGRHEEAAVLLEKHSSVTPQPQGDAAAAAAWEAAGKSQPAGLAWARVYFQFPQSAEAAKAKLAWQNLGSPSATPANYFQRADRSSAAQAVSVRDELLTVSASWPQPDREQAEVRAWSLLLRAKQYAAARTGLLGLTVTTPEAAAEREWHLYNLARRLDNNSERDAAFSRLAARHSRSPWYLEALLAEGYRLLNENDQAAYEPLYRTCAENFPNDPRAAFCHWKTVWVSYIQRRPGAETAMREHVERFPASEKVNAALYFLGRFAESRGQNAAAHAWFQSVVTRFPNSYYALIAADRLDVAAIKSAAPQPDVLAWLDKIAWPQRPTLPAAESPAAAHRRARAQLLQAAALDTYAEFELRQGAREEKLPVQLASDLASFMIKIGQLDKGLRYIKGLVPGYLFFPWDAPGEKFWSLAFPLPFFDKLELHATEYGVDPFLLAGLVRQESEFNPRVVSRSNAYGLAQILPSTGRDLSRRIGIKGFTTSRLYDPNFNLRLGAYYLRILAASLDGRWEDTLASYNGGRTRAVKWRSWMEYREPAEYIETIPFNETRDYVQSVLRNAAVYRRLYAGKPVPDYPASAAILSTNGAKPAATAPAARKPAAKKKPVSKRKNR